MGEGRLEEDLKPDCGRRTIGAGLLNYGRYRSRTM
jgi:hypothetical protein